MARKTDYSQLDKILDDMRRDPAEIIRRKNAGTYDEPDNGDGVDFSKMDFDEIRRYLDGVAKTLGG